MKPTDAAYIAGLLDGEGCFYIERFATDASPIGFQYRSIVTVTMCDKETIDHVCAITGKNFRERRLKSGRMAYTIDWRNNKAADLIRSILPHLIGKKKQAKWCLYFEEKIAPGRGRTYTPEHAVQCETIRTRLQVMKRPDALRC